MDRKINPNIIFSIALVSMVAEILFRIFFVSCGNGAHTLCAASLGSIFTKVVTYVSLFLYIVAYVIYEVSRFKHERSKRAAAFLYIALFGYATSLIMFYVLGMQN